MAQLPWIVPPVPIEIPQTPYSASTFRGNSLQSIAAAPQDIPGRMVESQSQESDATAATANDQLHAKTGQGLKVAPRDDHLTPPPRDMSGKTHNAINLDFLDFDLSTHDPSLIASCWPRPADPGCSSYEHNFDNSTTVIDSESTFRPVGEDLLEHAFLDTGWVQTPGGGIIDEGHILWWSEKAYVFPMSTESHENLGLYLMRQSQVLLLSVRWPHVVTCCSPPTSLSLHSSIALIAQ